MINIVFLYSIGQNYSYENIIFFSMDIYNQNLLFSIYYHNK